MSNNRGLAEEFLVVKSLGILPDDNVLDALSEALKCVTEGEISRALLHIEKAVDKSIWSLDRHFVTVEINLYSKVMKQLGDAAINELDRVRVELLKAKLLEARGDVTHAVDAYKAIIKIRPGFGPAYQALLFQLRKSDAEGQYKEYREAMLNKMLLEPEFEFRVGGEFLKSIFQERAFECIDQVEKDRLNRVKLRHTIGHFKRINELNPYAESFVPDHDLTMSKK